MNNAQITPHSGTGEKWVLIVDDEESILSVLKNSLKKFGSAFHVETASSGALALEILAKQSIDLVVTDYRMEDINGLELIEAVHALQPDARVILMTAFGNSGLESEASRLQAFRYLTKPLEITTFREIVKEALDNFAISRPGILILSDERYRQVNGLLGQLQSDVGARCIFLTDGNGHFIARTGDVAGLPLEQIATLVGGGVASLLEMGRMLDGEADTINLCYREGKNENVYVLNIGSQFLLIIICERGPYSSRLGSVWYFAQQTTAELRKRLGEAEYASLPPLNGAAIQQALDEELDNLFGEIADPPIEKSSQSRPTGEIVEGPLHYDQSKEMLCSEAPGIPVEQQVTSSVDELLSYEQAVARGLLGAMNSRSHPG